MRFTLEKRFDDFDKLHADLKEVDPGMCHGPGFGDVNVGDRKMPLHQLQIHPGRLTWNIIMVEPENDGLEDDFPFQLGDCWVPC